MSQGWFGPKFFNFAKGYERKVVLSGACPQEHNMRAGWFGPKLVNFVKGYEWELQNFKHYLWGWYNNYVNANPVVQVVDASKKKTELEAKEVPPPVTH